MASREREVFLGAMVFVAVAVLVVGSVWLSENFAGAAGGYKLIATFDSVQELKRGAEVTVRGVRVGKVLGIDIQDGRPVVMLGFERARNLPRDSRAVLKSEGMLGGKTVEIHIGSDSQLLADGERISGVTSPGLGELTAGFNDVASDVNRAVDKLVSEGNLSHIENILTQADSTTAGLKAVLEENREALSRALDSLALASADARGIVGDNRERVRQAVEDLRTTTERMAAMYENLEAASRSLRETLGNLYEVSRKIRDGEGSLGRLVNDEGLYEDLHRTVASVDSLLEDIMKDPKKYFKFSIF